MSETAKEPEDTSIKKRSHRLPSSYSDCSLHELEEFHDPFSEISLFLSEKITTEISAHGSAHEWSAQIEQDLLRKILPEFKARFPRYRLGLFALKKAFEKVAYFYDKLYCHEQNTPLLNPYTLIRDNIRHQLEIGSPASIKMLSEQIALQVGECLATLKGKKPNLTSIMAKTYSALKAIHPGVTERNPFYSCDARDSLIVKTQIETIAEFPEITFRQLRAVVEQKLHLLHDLPAPHKNSTIETLIATHLGAKWSATLKAKLCDKELYILRQLVSEEFQSGDLPPKIARHLEMILIMAKSCYSDQAPSNLLDLYQKEILDEFEENGRSRTQEQIEQISNLKEFLTLSTNDAKALIWALINERQASPSPLLLELIENEIVGVIRRSPTQNFWQIVQTALLSFKKAKEILNQQEGLEEKIEYWALQGELVFMELNLPNLPKRPKNSVFLSFHNEFTTREWIYERHDAYKKISGTPLNRYLALNKDSSNFFDKFPLLP